MITDLFDPVTGLRGNEPDNLTELVESMRTFGWDPGSPAFADENGLVLVGYRRLAAAAQLRAEGEDMPDRIVRLHFGEGDEADASRLRLAIGSDLGMKPLTPEHREFVDTVMGGSGWTEKTRYYSRPRSYPHPRPAKWPAGASWTDAAWAKRQKETEDGADRYEAFWAAHWAARQRASEVAVRTAQGEGFRSVCVQCGEPFLARRSTAQFCSNTCRQAAHRERQRALGPKRSGETGAA